MKKTILIFCLLLLPLVSADLTDPLKPVKQGDCTVFTNFCPTCTYTNLTNIEYGNGTITTNVNLAMTRSGNYYNYTFCDTESLGDYYYTTCGDKGSVGYESCEKFTFKVTTSGRAGSENIALTIILIVIVYAITFIGFFGKNIPITIIGGMFMTFFGLWIVRNGIVIYRDNLTNGFGYITIGLGALFALWAIVEWLMEDVF